MTDQPVPEPVAPSPRSPDPAPSPPHSLEDSAAVMAQLYLNHYHAKRTVATSDAMRTDVRTGLGDFRALLYSVEAPATDSERLIWLITNAATKENLVTLQQDIDAAIAAGTAADASATNDAVARIAATVNDGLGRVAKLQAKSDADNTLIAQLNAEIASGTVTPATAQKVADAFKATKDGIDSIDAAPIVVPPTVVSTVDNGDGTTTTTWSDGTTTTGPTPTA